MDKKCFLSVFAIFKNESHIIKEWIEHYLSEGVEHFWLIDNGSTDDYESEIQQYIDKITLFKDSTKHSQSPLYNKYVLPELYKTEWVIGCDLDEFMWSTKGTISDVLHDVEENIGLIQIPWEQYGSSGHVKQPENVISSFLNRKGGTYTIEQKCIGKGDAITTTRQKLLYRNVRRSFKRFKDSFGTLSSSITRLVLECEKYTWRCCFSNFRKFKK